MRIFPECKEGAHDEQPCEEHVGGGGGNDSLY